MTESAEVDLIALATPYALHAMGESELTEIERRLAGAPAEIARAFAEEVREVRETMAVMSAGTAVEPPRQLRDRVLAEVRDDPVRPLRPRRRWQQGALAAAAAIAIGVGGFGIGLALRPAATVSTAEQVFAAPDVHTISGKVAGGGTATVVFSREKNAGVLVMNNVTPPKSGTVYQMWLVDLDGPHSAGTMDAKAVAKSTTAVLSDLGDSFALAFTIEPPGGSQQPSAAPFAELPLV